MARIDSYENFLTDIGNSIREATSTKDQIYPADMDSVLLEHTCPKIVDCVEFGLRGDSEASFDLMCESTSLRIMPMLSSGSTWMFEKIDSDLLITSIAEQLEISTDDIYIQMMVSGMFDMTLGNYQGGFDMMDIGINFTQDVKYPAQLVLPEGFIVFSDKEEQGTIHTNSECAIDTYLFIHDPDLYKEPFNLNIKMVDESQKEIADTYTACVNLLSPDGYYYLRETSFTGSKGTVVVTSGEYKLKVKYVRNTGSTTNVFESQLDTYDVKVTDSDIDLTITLVAA